MTNFQKTADTALSALDILPAVEKTAREFEQYLSLTTEDLVKRALQRFASKRDASYVLTGIKKKASDGISIALAARRLIGEQEVEEGSEDAAILDALEKRAFKMPWGGLAKSVLPALGAAGAAGYAGHQIGARPQQNLADTRMRKMMLGETQHMFPYMMQSAMQTGSYAPLQQYFNRLGKYGVEPDYKSLVEYLMNSGATSWGQPRGIFGGGGSQFNPNTPLPKFNQQPLGWQP